MKDLSLSELLVRGNNTNEDVNCPKWVHKYLKNQILISRLTPVHHKALNKKQYWRCTSLFVPFLFQRITGHAYYKQHDVTQDISRQNDNTNHRTAGNATRVADALIGYQVYITNGCWRDESVPNVGKLPS